MADNAARALICLIEGESQLFRVKPTGSMDVITLKELVKDSGKNGVLSSVASKDLTLWRVRVSMASADAADSPAG